MCCIAELSSAWAARAASALKAASTWVLQSLQTRAQARRPYTVLAILSEVHEEIAEKSNSGNHLQSVAGEIVWYRPRVRARCAAHTHGRAASFMGLSPLAPFMGLPFESLLVVAREMHSALALPRFKPSRALKRSSH